MTLVDPFIPTHSSRPTLPPQKPKPGMVNNVAPYIVRNPPKAVDRVRVQRAPKPASQLAPPAPLARARQTLPRYPSPTPSAPAKPAHHSTTAAKPKHKKLGRTLSILHLLLGTAVIMGLGLFMPSLVIGEICVTAYALVALIVRIPSNAIFSLAAISLVGILVAEQFQDYSPVANVAIYTFMLLTVGALSLIRETVRRSKVEA
jgi:hypothetical protein